MKKELRVISTTLKVESNTMAISRTMPVICRMKSRLEVKRGGLDCGTGLTREKSKDCLKKLCLEAGASTNKQSPAFSSKLSKE